MPPVNAALKVMFIGAHPDDAEIYSFGTLFAYAERHAEIVLVLATAGEGGLTARSKHQPLAITRMAEAEQAAAMLMARVIQLGMEDGGLGPNRVSLMRKLTDFIIFEKPNVILTHSPNDYHPDHRVLSAAVSFAAADRVPVFFIDNMKGRNFTPTHYVNIKQYHAQKMLALIYSRPTATGELDVAWMQQLAYLDLSGDTPRPASPATRAENAPSWGFFLAAA